MDELSVSESGRGGATRPARLTANPFQPVAFASTAVDRQAVAYLAQRDGGRCGVCPSPAKTALGYVFRLVSAKSVRREAMPHNNVSIARHEAESRLCRWSISIHSIVARRAGPAPESVAGPAAGISRPRQTRRRLVTRASRRYLAQGRLLSVLVHSIPS